MNGSGGRWERLQTRGIRLQHQIQLALGSGSFIARIVGFIAEVMILGWAFIWINPPKGGLIVLAVTLAKFIPRIWKGSAPVSIKEIERSSRARSFAVAKLILSLGRWPKMTLAEAKSFQHQVLVEIASYARDLRGDSTGQRIFVNLLRSKDVATLEVVARSDGRPIGAVLPKEDSIAWRAIESGAETLCGDLYKECPNSPAGKKYQSILALPVFDPQGPRDTVLGAVTIDSREKHHFDDISEDVVILVMPLVQMLGWTLAREEWFSQQGKEQP